MKDFMQNYRSDDFALKSKLFQISSFFRSELGY